MPDTLTDCCSICGDACQVEDIRNYFACASCASRYPAALIKAHCDPFDYACGLRTGEVIRFHTAYISGQYVHLEGQGSRGSDTPVEGLSLPCCRGVDVRVADIIWCADAPEGS